MSSPLSGTISKNEGLREAFEFVVLLKEVQNGILQVSSKDINGHIGIFCAKYITGAKVADSDESGHQALKKLLSIKDGTFKFTPVEEGEISDLKQSLSIDINSLLEWSDNLADNISTRPLLDESLSGLAGTGEKVFLTDIGDEEFSEETNMLTFEPISEPVKANEADKTEMVTEQKELATNEKNKSKKGKNRNKDKAKNIAPEPEEKMIEPLTPIETPTDILSTNTVAALLEEPVATNANELKTPSPKEPVEKESEKEPVSPTNQSGNMSDYLQTVQGIKSIRTKQTNSLGFNINQTNLRKMNPNTLFIVAGISIVLIGLIIMLFFTTQNKPPAQITKDTTTIKTTTSSSKQISAMDHYRLGQAYGEQGNYKRAISELKTAIAMDSSLTYAKHQVEKYEDILKSKNRSYKRVQLQSQLQATENDVVERDITAGINDEATLVAKGYQALTAGAPSTAIIWLSKAVHLYPTRTLGRRYLAHALCQSARYRDAIKQFNGLETLEALNQADKLALARAYSSIDNSEKASDIYRACLDKDPNSAQIRAELVRSYLRLGLRERARKACLEGLQMAHTKQEWQTFKDLLSTIHDDNAPEPIPDRSSQGALP
jgi:tetratricopeptide (TPR) repeat protein